MFINSILDAVLIMQPAPAILTEMATHNERKDTGKKIVITSKTSSREKTRFRNQVSGVLHKIPLSHQNKNAAPHTCAPGRPTGSSSNANDHGDAVVTYTQSSACVPISGLAPQNDSCFLFSASFNRQEEEASSSRSSISSILRSIVTALLEESDGTQRSSSCRLVFL